MKREKKMTVKQLIEILQKHPETNNIVVKGVSGQPWSLAINSENVKIKNTIEIIVK